MENKKKSEFNKVFSAWDILVIAFGAMIGWGWVVSTGDWINTGGVIGAILGFVIGGIMIFFVGTDLRRTYGCPSSVRRRTCLQLPRHGPHRLLYLYMGHYFGICQRCML